MVTAWHAEQATRHTCGQPSDESFAKENSFEYRAEVIQCHACAAMARVISKYQEDGGDMAGIFARLTRTPHNHT